MSGNCGVVVIITTQLHSTKPDLRFCAGSNPARSVSEIRDGEDLWQWSRLEIRLRLSSVNHTTKTIHHHHHHHHHHQLQYTMFITNNHASLPLWWKENLVKVTKILKILCPWFSAKFHFGFYVFTSSSNFYRHISAGIYLMFLKNVLGQTWNTVLVNSHILAGIYLIFLKKVLDETWRSFKIEFGPQRKYRKKSYQVRQKFSTFLQRNCSNFGLILC